MPSRSEADISGMLPCAPTDTLLPEQKEFADRVATLKTADDLAAFMNDVDVWLHTPGVSNCISPKTLDGAWRLLLESAPFEMTDDEKNALASGIRAFTFRE
jgi:hypothetical protein